MKQTTIKSINQLLEKFDEYSTSTAYKFRGQSKTGLDLIPKTARPPFSNRDDLEIFRHWKRRAKSILKKEVSSDIHLLTIAQHFGLATRLLDWSLNPLIATYFACYENFEFDGEIIVFRAKTNLPSDTIENPFETQKDAIVMVQPESSSGRLDNQSGYFSLHNPPGLKVSDIHSKYLQSILIPKELKKEIVFKLNQFGVNNLGLFPDLEGLTKHLNWFYENYDYWTK